MLKGDWFTEVCKECGTGFSLQLEKKLHEEKTPFQTIAIYETSTFGNLMVIDGCTMLSTRDNFLYHEMMSHPVLFTPPEPQNVVIIGGGDCGTLQQVLRHPEVGHVWQIDIDERVTRLSEQYFPELCESNNDPRAELLFIDGIRWMAEREAGSVDVIIIDSTDPVGPAEGLFTESFYRDCHRVLRPHGLIVQQSESPLVHMNILKAMYRAIGTAGFADIQTLHFPQCIYPTGWWSATMACKDGAIDGFREQAVLNKPFATQYYNAAIHQASLAVPEFFAREIKNK